MRQHALRSSPAQHSLLESHWYANLLPCRQAHPPIHTHISVYGVYSLRITPTTPHEEQLRNMHDEVVGWPHRQLPATCGHADFCPVTGQRITAPAGSYVIRSYFFLSVIRIDGVRIQHTSTEYSVLKAQSCEHFCCTSARHSDRKFEPADHECILTANAQSRRQVFFLTRAV